MNIGITYLLFWLSKFITSRFSERFVRPYIIGYIWNIWNQILWSICNWQYAGICFDVHGLREVWWNIIWGWLAWHNEGRRLIWSLPIWSWLAISFYNFNNKIIFACIAKICKCDFCVIFKLCANWIFLYWADLDIFEIITKLCHIIFSSRCNWYCACTLIDINSTWWI